MDISFSPNGAFIFTPLLVNGIGPITTSTSFGIALLIFSVKIICTHKIPPYAYYIEFF